MLSNQSMKRKVVGGEIFGFLLAILTCWITEIFDPPFSMQQVLIESLALLILGGSIVRWTLNALERIRKLEGFILMCASCKSVKVDGKWAKVETVLGHDQPLRISHGMCPDCFEKFQREFRN